VFEDGAVSALTFLGDPATELVVPDLPRDLQVEFLATGQGFLGTAADYIRGVVAKCRQLGIEDAETEALLADVEARIAAEA
jgi:cation transport regulator ChaC